MASAEKAEAFSLIAILSSGQTISIENMWTLSEILEDKDARQPPEILFDEVEMETIQRLHGSIEERDDKILRMRYGLESARKDLKGGNLQKAISSYGRAKFKGAQVQTDQAEGRELKELEQDVRRAQSSNLIIAQNNYFIENAGRLGDQQALQLQAGRPATAELVDGPVELPDIDEAIIAGLTRELGSSHFVQEV